MLKKIGHDLFTMCLGFGLIFAIGEWASNLYYYTDLTKESCAAIGVVVFIAIVAVRRTIHELVKKEVRKNVVSLIRSVKNELREG